MNVELIETVQHEVEDYARGKTWKAVMYPLSDVPRQHFSLIYIPDYPREEQPAVAVMARIVGDHVIIDADMTDKPLVLELVRAGIPREKIVLAYAGEHIPAE